jgi:hypothetical protein
MISRKDFEKYQLEQEGIVVPHPSKTIGFGWTRQMPDGSTRSRRMRCQAHKGGLQVLIDSEDEPITVVGFVMTKEQIGRLRSFLDGWQP